MKAARQLELGCFQIELFIYWQVFPSVFSKQRGWLISIHLWKGTRCLLNQESISLRGLSGVIDGHHQASSLHHVLCYRAFPLMDTTFGFIKKLAWDFREKSSKVAKLLKRVSLLKSSINKLLNEASFVAVWLKQYELEWHKNSSHPSLDGRFLCKFLFCYTCGHMAEELCLLTAAFWSKGKFWVM